MDRQRLLSAAGCALAVALAPLALGMGGGAAAEDMRVAVLTSPSPSAVRAPELDQVGMATWYGEDFGGRYTSSGERFDRFQLTAAHPSLPMGALVAVTNLENGRKVTVRINDRPLDEEGVIVLSKAAALELGFAQAGQTDVQLRVVGMVDNNPVEVVSNVRKRAAKVRQHGSACVRGEWETETEFNPWAPACTVVSF